MQLLNFYPIRYIPFFKEHLTLLPRRNVLKYFEADFDSVYLLFSIGANQPEAY